MIWRWCVEIMEVLTDAVISWEQYRYKRNRPCHDIVIGPIADDDMALLFRQYENGMITFENMLSGMIYKKTTNQYSFHTEKAIALLKKVGV